MAGEQGEIPCGVKEAFWNQLASSVTGGNDNLLPLGIYMLSKRFARLRDVGAMTVAADRIRGKVGLSSDFDESLLPREQHIRYQWTSIDRARFHDTALPQINLLKIGDSYLVLDGHHRVSVASIHDQDAIEAHVIEVVQDNECQSDEQVELVNNKSEDKYA